MDHTKAILIALAVALAHGCGDDDVRPGTDAGGVDAGGGDDDAGGGMDAGGDAGAATDGGADDAGGDAGPIVGTEYVYWFGDFVTDGAFNVGRREIGTTTDQVLMPMGLVDAESIMAIAVSPDGTRLAIAGRATAADAAVLAVYAADGTGTPTMIASAPDATRDFADVAFSPDGAYLAWTAAFETTGNFDDNDDALYAAPADGTGTPVRLSPDVAANNLVVAAFVWADATHVVFTGDLVTNNVDSIWSVEVTVPGTPVELVDSSSFSTTQDVGNEVIEIDAMGRVYFRADYVGANNEFHMYRNALDGASFEEVPGTALANGSGPAAIGTFGISADGARLAFSSDSPVADLYEVYVLDLAATTATQVSAITTMETFAQGPDFGDPLVWSPDGALIAFDADYALAAGDPDNSFSVFVVPSTGTGGTRLFGVPADADLDASAVAWSPAGTMLLSRADYVTNAENELYGTSDLATADQAIASVTVVDAPSDGDVLGFTLAIVP